MKCFSGDMKSNKDLLNCGNCKNSFSLDNITLFLQRKITGCQQVKEKIHNQSTLKINSSSPSYFVQNSVASSTTRDGKENHLHAVIMKFMFSEPQDYICAQCNESVTIEQIIEKHGVVLSKEVKTM